MAKEIKFWKAMLLIWWSFIFIPIGALLSKNQWITISMFIFALSYPGFALIIMLKLSIKNKIIILIN